jgi:hypothetical protein
MDYDDFEIEELAGSRGRSYVDPTASGIKRAKERIDGYKYERDFMAKLSESLKATLKDMKKHELRTLSGDIQALVNKLDWRVLKLAPIIAEEQENLAEAQRLFRRGETEMVAAMRARRQMKVKLSPRVAPTMKKYVKVKIPRLL